MQQQQYNWRQLCRYEVARTLAHVYSFRSVVLSVGGGRPIPLRCSSYQCRSPLRFSRFVDDNTFAWPAAVAECVRTVAAAVVRLNNVANVLRPPDDADCLAVSSGVIRDILPFQLFSFLLILSWNLNL